MKILVKNEVGNPIESDGEVLGYHTFVDGDLKFESAFFPAPGIPDGEHECELAYQGYSRSSAQWSDISKELFDRWQREHEPKIIWTTRQIYRLSPLKEQGERSGVKTFDEILQNHYIHDKGLNNPEYVKNAAFEFATQVAEAVLKQACQYSDDGFTGKQIIEAINISQFIK